MPRTPYTETEFLLAVMEQDVDRVRALYLAMLSGERAILRRQFSLAQEALTGDWEAVRDA